MRTNNSKRLQDEGAVLTQKEHDKFLRLKNLVEKHDYTKCSPEIKALATELLQFADDMLGKPIINSVHKSNRANFGRIRCEQK